MPTAQIAPTARDSDRAAPSLSVVLPLYNNPEYLERSLAALRASSAPFELILVDDSSSDARAIEIAKTAGGKYVRLERNSGPAVARNAGARLATAEILVFIDSDVLVEPGTLASLRRVLVENEQVAACFGSYDAAPASRGMVTEYRNLLHHYVHQSGPPEASTFWAGCGAVRRAVFHALGGFDESYARPSIEDIELGMRIRAAGHSIRLCPRIQCKHLKRWRFVEMIKIDVQRRAIPWTHLLIDRPGTGGDLNLERAQKLCVALVFLALASLAAMAVLARVSGPRVPWWTPLAMLLPVLWINRGLYGLFLRHRGPFFALAGVSLHWLYYLYGGLAFLYAHATHRRPRKRAQTAAS